LHLTDGGVAFLTGVPLALFYVSSAAISWLADRSNRRNILAAALVTWSALRCCAGARRPIGSFSSDASAWASASRWTAAFLSIVSIAFRRIAGPWPSLCWLSERHRRLARADVRARLPAPTAGAAFIALGCPGDRGILVYLTIREPARGRLDANADSRKPTMAGS